MEEFFENIKNNKIKIEGPNFLVTERHWGFSVVLDANTRMHLITGEPSVQFHRHRVEEYILYSGEMTVYRGSGVESSLEKTIANMEAVQMKPGDKIVIGHNVLHIPVNTGKDPAIFIEISHGPYEESDIERIYDKNSRDAELSKKWKQLGYEPGLSVIEVIRRAKSKLSK